MKGLMIVLACVWLQLPAMAQGPGEPVPYSKNIARDRGVIRWQHLREADVMWARRIWRIIDVREKQNQPMQWPKNPLNVIVYNAVVSGRLTPYNDDSLTGSRTIEQFRNFNSSKQPVKKLYDEMGDPDDPENVWYDTIDVVKTAQDIKKYKVVEDWIFDKKESRMYVRIIAIAPMVNFVIEGMEGQEVEWCWLKYHKDPGDADLADLRTVLVNMEVFNRQNDAGRLTYDDWFEQRLFSSYIVKEANPYDLAINQLGEFRDDGLAALLESERIKQELFEKEHDLWEY